MGRIWTKGFWKDLTERVGSTAAESLLGTLISVGFDLDKLLSWEGVWKGVASTTLVALVKVLLAGMANPTTGGSLGTTVPAAAADTIVTPDGSKVAGPGSVHEDGTPMQSEPLPPDNLAEPLRNTGGGV